MYCLRVQNRYLLHLTVFICYLSPQQDHIVRLLGSLMTRFMCFNLASFPVQPVKIPFRLEINKVIPLEHADKLNKVRIYFAGILRMEESDL